MKRLTRSRAESCSMCGKPRLYGGKRRCACGDPIGYFIAPTYPQEHAGDDTLRFVRERLEYATRELDAVASSGNPLQFRRDVRSLSRWLRILEAYLPAEGEEATA